MEGFSVPVIAIRRTPASAAVSPAAVVVEGTRPKLASRAGCAAEKWIASVDSPVGMKCRQARGDAGRIRKILGDRKCLTGFEAIGDGDGSIPLRHCERGVVDLSGCEDRLDMGMGCGRGCPYRGEELGDPNGVGIGAGKPNQDGTLKSLVGRQPLLNVAVRSEAHIHAVPIGDPRRHESTPAEQGEWFGERRKPLRLVEADGGTIVGLRVQDHRLAPGLAGHTSGSSSQRSAHLLALPFRMHRESLEVCHGVPEPDDRECNRGSIGSTDQQGPGRSGRRDRFRHSVSIEPPEAVERCMVDVKEGVDRGVRGSDDEVIRGREVVVEVEPHQCQRDEFVETRRLPRTTT